MSSFPSTVERITIAKTGDYDVLEKTTQPFPELDTKQLVVKVEYGGVNFIDTYFRTGLYPLPSFPAAIGGEYAGVIVGLPTDESVVNDPAYKQRGYKIGSKVAGHAQGSHSTYISTPWTAAVPVPENVESRIAAAAFTQGLTTLTLSHESYEIKKGDTVMIHTVAGGVGLLLAQYAKSKGATVIGTTSTKDKAELAKAHGADHVILYKDEDTVKRVEEITGGKGANVIYDGVGKDTFENNFKIIKRGGTIVSFGNASGAVPPLDIRKLVPKNVKLLRPSVFSYIQTAEEFAHWSSLLWNAVGQNVLTINIHKEYPFSAEGVQQAQKDLVGGKSTGKLLIKIRE